MFHAFQYCHSLGWIQVQPFIQQIVQHVHQLDVISSGLKDQSIYKYYRYYSIAIEWFHLGASENGS